MAFELILKMKTILLPLALMILMSGTAHADYRRYCDSVSTNAESFTEERKKGRTKKQVQENARLMAQQRELDPSVLEAKNAMVRSPAGSVALMNACPMRANKP